MPSVRLSRLDDVAVVTLARPPANVMDVASLTELAGVFDQLGSDDSLRGVVLTGEGRSFCAGLDLLAIQGSGPELQEPLIEALNRAFLAVFSFPRLVVAAVNGHAIAGGLVLVLCCDIRIAADVPLRAGLAEVRVGVPYPVGAIEVVRQELAAGVARRLVLEGELVDVAAGRELGLFDRIVPPDALLETAVAAVRDGPPPRAYGVIKAQLRAPAVDTIRGALDGRDPLPRPWLTDETFEAAAAALRHR